jgi:hypothetical protein
METKPILQEKVLKIAHIPQLHLFHQNLLKKTVSLLSYTSCHLTTEIHDLRLLKQLSSILFLRSS